MNIFVEYSLRVMPTQYCCLKFKFLNASCYYNNSIFSDLDEDNQISESDITQIIDRITGEPHDCSNYIDNESKKKIANIVRT